MHKETLNRFIEAQENTYPSALREIKNGRKSSHWMWFVFPQIDGLGFSEMSQKYSIKDMREAERYLAHPILGMRLVEITKELVNLKESNATIIFGSPDDMKIRSCMTLFSCVPGSDDVFRQVLFKFFHSQKDPQTLALLK